MKILKLKRGSQTQNYISRANRAMFECVYTTRSKVGNTCEKQSLYYYQLIT